MIGGQFLMTEQNNTERLTEQEFEELNLAKQNVNFTQVNLEKVQAQSDVADLKLRNILLHYYLKYGLILQQDSIQTDGTILRGKKESVEKESK